MTALRASELALPQGCESACRGCRYRQLAPIDSHQRKLDWLKRILAPWELQLQPLQFDPCASWHYRRRAQLAAQWAPELAPPWQLGLRRREAIIAIPDCPIHHPRINAAAAIIRRYLPDFHEFPLFVYAQTDHQIALVVKAKSAATAWVNEALIGELRCHQIEGLWLHCHPAAGIHLFAKSRWQLLWGQATSRSAEGLIYGPTSFIQQQSHLHESALELATRFLSPTADDWLLDLYCGLGASLRRWLMRTPHVLGVESAREALQCAAMNAPQAQQLLGLVHQRLPQIAAWWVNSAPDERLLYVNPPRTGLDDITRDWLCRAGRPRKIAYLACAAGPLRRDLTQLVQVGYRVEALHPWDFFPQTDHVEVLALLSRLPHGSPPIEPLP